MSSGDPSPASYYRILLKLSGEALMGDQAYGIDPAVADRIARDVAEIQSLGVQTSIVIGGGNIFRGLAASAHGMDRSTADYMGMLGTVINALALQDALEKHGVPTRVLTAIAILGPPLVRPADIPPLASEAFTVALSSIGLLVVIAGKMSLGRSFGLMPAHRGIVSSGLYRLVRHPIYLGYLITHVAFIAANPTSWNVAVLVAADLGLMARAVCEETTLARDPEYVAYQARVRWRVVPGVF